MLLSLHVLTVFLRYLRVTVALPVSLPIFFFSKGLVDLFDKWKDDKMREEIPLCVSM